VIKVIWAREWDDLLAKDDDGELVRKMDATVDGEFQKYTVAGGAYIREHFFGPEPLLQKLVGHLSDDDLVKLRRGGHDYRKIHAAYAAAVAHKGAPTVILAKTVKGWTLGPSVEATNPAHQAKKLSEVELLAFRDRLGLPIPDAKIPEAPYYHPGPKSPEVAYITERRAALGGPLPSRVVHPVTWTPPLAAVDDEFAAGSAAPVSTTMAFAKLLRNLMRDPALGKLIVPIVPDEARTFGMDPLFKQAGIYAPFGQRYEPVDSELLLSYRESQSGQVLEEGITEAGSMASFQASGTAYATHAVGTIPFYVFYSMFGFQRVGDQIWQSGDARVRGFLIGATAGRTTLAGEGLQHDDGHSQLIAHAMPHVAAYDPSFAYEMAALVRKGIERMHERGEDIVYYLTIYNENQVQPQLPVGASVGEGIHRGLYKFAEADAASSGPRVRLFGSGAIMGEVLKARDLLRERFGVRAEIWSATSYSELRREALVVERWNRRHPEATPRKAWLQEQLGDDSAPIVAASDWMTAIPDLVAPWINVPYLVLGTDGFGLSDTREALRDFFSVDSTHIAAAAMVALARSGERTPRDAAAAVKELGIDPELQPVFVLDR
jgi:pyruvate dehydrogenase E1 component